MSTSMSISTAHGNMQIPESTMLPPPPIFKPKFVSMSKAKSSSSSSFSVSSESLATATSTSIATAPITAPSQHVAVLPTPAASTEGVHDSSNTNTNTTTNTTTNNSNFLTSSFVSNEDYKSQVFSHSPCISPMTRFTDQPLPSDMEDASSSFSPSFSLGSNPNPPTSAKKRRRSSLTNNSKEELARKKKELKTQHSIIEKRRRIKMNREFEALKFLVPACRVNILSGLNEGNHFDNSNMMHKLTILQSTVEYIKYLHLIIKLMKLQMLIPKETRPTMKNWLKKNDNLNFVDFDLDLQAYRDLEKEYDFESLFLTIQESNGTVPQDWLDPISKQITKVLDPVPESYSSSNSSNDRLRSLSFPNIQSSSSNSIPPSLREKIQENSRYRHSILQLQKDSNSFKLPLPAIIDKHPEISQMAAPPAVSHSQRYQNSVSPISTASSSSISLSPTSRSNSNSNLYLSSNSNASQHRIHAEHRIPNSFEVQTQQSIPSRYTYSMPHPHQLGTFQTQPSQPAHALQPSQSFRAAASLSRGPQAVSQNVVQEKKVQVQVHTHGNGNGNVHTHTASANIVTENLDVQEASHLLMGIKSRNGSDSGTGTGTSTGAGVSTSQGRKCERSPSIKNILN